MKTLKHKLSKLYFDKYNFIKNRPVSLTLTIRFLEFILSYKMADDLYEKFN